MQTLLGVFRQPNTTTASQPFDQATINAVWEKGRIVPGYDASRYRKDACGAWIIPVARGGADIVANLQPQLYSGIFEAERIAVVIFSDKWR